MTRRLQIALDVDGVLADLVGELLLRMAKRGHHYRVEDVKNFDFSKTFTPDAMLCANEIMGSPGFAKQLPWYSCARLFVSSVRDLGDLVIATAPFRSSASWASDRAEWLDAYVLPNSIISVPTKLKHLATQFADVLVEDRVETLEAWKAVRPDGVAVLIDRPWNRVSAPYATRVTSYLSAIEVIRSRVSRAA